MKLLVFNYNGSTTPSDHTLWFAYTVINGRAIRVATATHLDDLRHYADCNDYDGILLGGRPSVKWARLEDCNDYITPARL